MLGNVPQRSRTSRNLAWNYGSGIGGLAGTILLYPVAIRTAGATEYGLWLLGFTAVQLLGQADFGLGTGVVRTLSRLRAQGQDRLGDRRFVVVACSLFLLASAPAMVLGFLVLTVTFRHAEVPQALQQNLPVIFLLTITSTGVVLLGRAAVSVLWAEDRPDIERKGALLALAVRAVILLIAQDASEPFLLVMLSDVAAAVIPGLICVVLVMKRYPPTKVTRSEWTGIATPLTRLSGVLFIGSFSSLVVVQAPLYVIGTQIGLASATALSALLRIYQSASMLLSWTVNPFTAVVAGLRPGTPQADTFFWRLIASCSVVGVLLGAPLIGMPDVVLGLWLGPGFESAADGLVVIGLVLALSAVFLSANLFSNLLGRPIWPSLASLAWLLGTLALSTRPTFQSSILSVTLTVAIPLAVLLPLYFSLGRRAAGARYTRRVGSVAARLLAVVALVLVGAYTIGHVLDTWLDPWLQLASYAALVCMLLALSAPAWRRVLSR